VNEDVLIDHFCELGDIIGLEDPEVTPHDRVCWATDVNADSPDAYDDSLFTAIANDLVKAS
jgi:hypothetical protein